jgi:hypothetical protein
MGGMDLIRYAQCWMQLRPNLPTGHADLIATPLGRLSCDMALPPKEPKTPLWLYAVAIAVGFALGAGLALLFIR